MNNITQKKIFRFAVLLVLFCVKLNYADLVKIPFINTKYKGERVKIDVFSNSASTKYFTTKFLDGREGAGKYVRFDNNQEGVFLIDNKAGKIKHINSNLNRYTYFTNRFSPGGAVLYNPTDLSVDKAGNLFVMDYANGYIHKIKLDVSGGSYNWSSHNKKYLVDVQDHSPQYIAHVNNGTKKLIFAMNDLGTIHVLDYNLDPILDHSSEPLKYQIKFPGGAFKKLKCDPSGIGNTVKLYTSTRPPDSIPGKGYLNEGWMEIKYDVTTNVFYDEKFVESGPQRVPDFVDFQPFYISRDPAPPLLHMFVVDIWGGVHEFSESGQIVRTIISGLDEADPRKAQENPELLNPQSIMSCNDMSNYNVCKNLLVAEDFRENSRGLVRFQYVTNPNDRLFIPLQVEIKETCDCSNMNKPKIKITNLSSTDVLSDFTLRLWMSKEEYSYQSVIADKYYFEPNGVTLRTGSHPLNSNIIFVDIIYPPDYELLPNQSTSDDGAQLGIHFNQFWPGNWERSNDWSWKNITNEFKKTNNITVYDSTGFLIYGVEPDPTDIPAPLNVPTKDIFGFENILGWLSDQATLGLSSTSTQGDKSLTVSGSGYIVMSSIPLKTDSLENISDTLALDIYIPSNQYNNYWIGSAQVFVDCFSAGIHNHFLGQVELTGKPTGVFSTLKFFVNNTISNALIESHPDLGIKIVLNLGGSADQYLIDNLRFINN